MRGDDGLLPHDEDPSGRAVGQQRRRVLSLLRESADPVVAQHVADVLRIHVTTARFHLATLERQGRVRRAGDARGPRPGRPRSTYEIVPRLDYSDVVAVFAAHLGGTPDERETRARLIGADLARRAMLTRPRPDRSLSDLVIHALGELGFEVRSVIAAFGETTLQICTCPLAEVAASSPEVVRGIQQGLIREVVDSNYGPDNVFEVMVVPDPLQGACEISVAIRPVKPR